MSKKKKVVFNFDPPSLEPVTERTGARKVELLIASSYQPMPFEHAQTARQTAPTAWRSVASQLPDAGTVVLIACPESAEPVLIGLFNGIVWITLQGDQVLVSHWMDLPEAPGMTSI